MRPLSLDSRLLLLGFLGETAAADVRELADLWTHTSRRGSIAQHLRNLEAEGSIGRVGDGPLDSRLIRLTPRGARLLAAGVDPAGLWSRSWDGQP